MSSVSNMYWNDQLGRTQPRLLRLVYKITAAKTASQMVANSAAYVTFDAIAAQSTIDDFLGTSSEFLLAAFDATAMGNDTIAFIVNMNGQVKTLVDVVATCYSGTGGSTQVIRQCQVSTTLTASTLATESALGSSGNLAVKIDFGNTPDFDGLTSGTIHVDFYYISK